MIPLPIVTAIGLMLLWSSAGLAASDRTRIACGMCEEPDRFVRYQTNTTEKLTEGATIFSHPVTLSPEDWARLLYRIHVQSQLDTVLFGQTKGPVVAAFTDEQIQFLSPALSRAFASARPDEMIVFGLAAPRTTELTEITTGGWFVAGDVLHLILANYRTAVGLPGVRTLLWDDPLKTQPGLRYDLVPGDDQAPVPHKASLNPFGAPPPSQIAIQYRSIIQTDRASSIPLASPDSLLEERLARLKRLREEGLITEEDYIAKKKELLDRL